MSRWLTLSCKQVGRPLPCHSLKTLEHKKHSPPLPCTQTLLLLSLHLAAGLYPWSFHSCAVGFSSVLFSLKYVLNATSPGYTSVGGFQVPTRQVHYAPNHLLLSVDESAAHDIRLVPVWMFESKGHSDSPRGVSLSCMHWSAASCA